jgi:hypothetical protein
MHRVNLLRHYGVKPVLVFDGGLLPMKIEQENKRARYFLLGHHEYSDLLAALQSYNVINYPYCCFLHVFSMMIMSILYAVSAGLERITLNVQLNTNQMEILQLRMNATRKLLIFHLRLRES